MPIENALQLLEARRSVPSRQLGEPGPDQATLLRMLQAAVRVPDHGRKVPFRFLRIAGDARVALGSFLAERAKQLNPDIAEPALELEHKRFNHAPLVIAVIARPTPHPKVPEIEQLLTSGCVCFALLQAAQAFGFGAQWLTGWAAYDPVIQSRLGLAPGESISGFIHIGTPLAEPPARERPDAAALLHEWTA